MKLRLIIMVLLSFIGSNAFAYHFCVDGIYYNITSLESPYEVEVTYKDDKYMSYTGDVVIPESFMYNNSKYLVTSIGEDAFYNSDGLKSIEIPESIAKVGDYTFEGCDDITKVIWNAKNLEVNVMMSLKRHLFMLSP